MNKIMNLTDDYTRVRAKAIAALPTLLDWGERIAHDEMALIAISNTSQFAVLLFIDSEMASVEGEPILAILKEGCDFAQVGTVSIKTNDMLVLDETWNLAIVEPCSVWGEIPLNELPTQSSN